MKKGLLMCFVLMLSLLGGSAWAQRTTLNGVVTDANGSPIPGVAVLIEGTSLGTATNVEGEYQLDVPSNASIVFKGVGLKTVIFAVADVPSELAMEDEVKGLDAIVVNALGFEQDKDKTASSSSTVSGSSLVDSGEPNLINSLNGKSSGINIVEASGDPGAGSRIIIRGATTITGSTEPLIVVDGIPMFNDSFFGNGSNYLGSSGGVAQQSRLNDINPSDIANVEILKGAPAAALWGARAANGVILITTKKGAGKTGAGKNYTITLNSSLSYDVINKTVPLQNTFGGGNSGLYQFAPTGGRSWGDKISTRAGGADVLNSATGNAFAVGEKGELIYSTPNGTNANPHGGKNDKWQSASQDYLFKTGVTWNNTISVGSSTANGNFYLSVGDLRQEGIIKKNSDYRRTTLKLNMSRNLGKIASVSANLGYSKVFSNRIQTGSNLSGLFLGGLRTPADFNPNPYTVTYVDAAGNSFAGRQRAYRNPLGASTVSIYDNPLWMMDNIQSTAEVDRFIGSVEVTADPFSFLNLTARGGIDSYVDVRNDYSPDINSTTPGGKYVKETIAATQLNFDFIARGHYNIGDNFKGTLLAGLGLNERKNNNVGATVTNFTNPLSPAQLSNTSAGNIASFNSTTVIRTVGYYFSASFDIYDMVFVNVGGRLDQWSTFGKQFQSGFFYPSADIAFQFSKLIPENDIFTFGKIRAGYGVVGRGPNPYQTQTYYGSVDGLNNQVVGYAEGWGSALNGSAYGGAYAQNNNAGNKDIKPETKTEIELGLDLRFLKDRLSLSGTYYQNTTKDAILATPVANSTGYNSQLSNSATIENTGYELNLSGEILKIGDFSWTVNANYSRNINKVTALAPGVSNLFLGGFGGSSSYAVVGHQLGVLWGSQWLKNADNKSYALDANGFPQTRDQEGVLGDPNPEYRYGIGTTLKYKNITFNALLDASVGGKMWNGTKGALNFFGRSKDTGKEVTLSAAEANSLKIWTGQTVAQVYAATPAKVTFDAAANTYTIRGQRQNFGAGDVILNEDWYRVGPGSGFTGPTEPTIEDASWVRLREISLAYTFNQEWFRRALKLQDLTISVTARNAGLWTSYSGVDPSTNLGGQGAGFNALGIDYFNNPATRSIIFGIKATY